MRLINVKLFWVSKISMRDFNGRHDMLKEPLGNADVLVASLSSKSRRGRRRSQGLHNGTAYQRQLKSFLKNVVNRRSEERWYGVRESNP